MKGTMLIYRPGTLVAETVTFDHAPTLDELKVPLNDGHLESVPYFTQIEIDGKWRNCWAICDEEGKFKELSYNEHAMRLWGKSLYRSGLDVTLNDVLVGPVVVLFGDDEFMASL